jgi:hypothetical protein
MNTYNINIKKCQEQVISCSERLASICSELYHLKHFSSRETDKKIQEIYEDYCEFEKQDKKALEEAQKELDKAQKLFKN